MRVMKMSHASNKKRSLKLWEALALSLGMVGPTLAMSGNAQGLIDSVGKGIADCVCIRSDRGSINCLWFYPFDPIFIITLVVPTVWSEKLSVLAPGSFPVLPLWERIFSFRLAHLRHWVHLPMLFWPHYSPPLVFRSHGLSLRQLGDI
jgi:hypothetical protein